MMKTRSSLQPSMDENTSFLCLFPALDPNSQSPNTNFNFTTDSYFMERGPRYEAYSKLRDSKLRMKLTPSVSDFVEIEVPKSDYSPSPVKKSVKFQDPGAFPGPKRRVLRPPAASSLVAQSVPDFSSAIRKENRRPPPPNRVMDKSATPPPLPKTSKLYGSGSKLGSRSVNSGERKAGGGSRLVGARKSYASIDELKGLSAAASLAIAGENKGGRGGGQRVVGRSSVLGVRQSVQFY